MLGLSAMQFFCSIALIGMSITIMVTASADMATIIIVIMIEIVPIVFYSARSSIEHKKGNSFFLSSWLMFSNTPRKIFDGKGILNYLKN